MSFTRRSLRCSTVAPSFLEFTSRSSKSPAKSLSLSVPRALSSMERNTALNVSFRFSSDAARSRTFAKSWLGRMKKPFSSISPSLASSASASDMAA